MFFWDWRNHFKHSLSVVNEDHYLQYIDIIFQHILEIKNTAIHCTKERGHRLRANWNFGGKWPVTLVRIRTCRCYNVFGLQVNRIWRWNVEERHDGVTRFVTVIRNSEVGQCSVLQVPKERISSRMLMTYLRLAKTRFVLRTSTRCNLMWRLPERTLVFQITLSVPEIYWQLRCNWTN